MAIVKALCISEKKGIRKKEVDSVTVSKEAGIVDDAHGENIVRQVSFLGEQSVDKLRDKMPQLAPGDFAENILVEGLTLYTLPVGTKMRVGDTMFEVTQIGKECHHGCEIRRITGDCVMPREGIFAKVLKEGIIHRGDTLEVVDE